MNQESSEEIHEEVRSLCQELVRSLKSVALYRHDPRRFPELLAPFYRGLRQLLAHHTPLQLVVSADAFLFENKRVFEDSHGEVRLCFRYYNEGIRSIRFHEGVQLDELTEFIELSLPNLNEMSAELVPGELLTRLWKAGLPSITYKKADHLNLLPEDRAEEVQETVKQIARDVTQLLANEKTKVTEFDIANTLPEIPQDEVSPWATSSQVGAGSSGVQGGLKDHPAAVESVLDRFAKLLVVLLNADSRGLDSEIIQRGFVCLLHEAFKSSQITVVPQLIEQLDAEPADDEPRQDRIRRVYVLNAIRAALNDEDYIRLLQPMSSQADGLEALCAKAGVEALPAYVESMERADGPAAITAMASGMGNKLNVSLEALETLLTLPSAATVVPAFAAGMSDFRPSDPARNLLERGLTHQEVGVRSGVMSMLSAALNITNLKDAARGLQSSDAIERMACVKSLSRSRDNNAAKTLVTWLEGLDLQSLPREEVTQAYQALGSMHSIHGLEFLKKQLLDKSLLGRWKSSPPEQALAVHGLSSAGDATSRKVLLEANKEKELPGPVKMALKSALSGASP